MVAVVAGAGLGLSNTSRDLAGQAGELGQSAFGRANERVTVNAATGNLVIQNSDEFLVGVGEDVGVVRTYNSLGGWDGDNDDGWRVGFYRRVTDLTGTINTAGSTVTRTDADGFRAVYTYSGGRYVTKDGAGAYDSLSFAVGAWTWTDGDTGVSESYAEASSGSGIFRLTQVTDVEGHAIKVGYDGNGLITTLESWPLGAASASETVTLTYDAATKQLTQIATTFKKIVGQALQDAIRTRERFEYDADGRLAVVRTDLSPDDNSIADGRSYAVTYGYDASGRVSSIVQTDGTSLTLEYDGSGRVSKYTDGLGRATTLTYDTASRKTTILDALGQETALAYDAANRLVEVSGAMAGGAAFRQGLGYDADGNLVSLENPAGEELSFAYDASGNMVRRTDAAGDVLEQTYDAANRMVSQTTYAVADPDSAGPALPSGAARTQYIYEGATTRRLRFTVSPEGRVVEHQYNALGQRISTSTYAAVLYTGSSASTLADLSAWANNLGAGDKAAAEHMEFGYDLRGQLVLSRTYASASVSSGTIAYGTPADTRYVYDAFGNLLQTIDAVGGTTAYAYDGMNRLVLKQDEKNFTTLYQYDDAGNRIIVRHPVDNTGEIQIYDRAGQLQWTYEGVISQAVWNRGFAAATTPDYSGLSMPSSGVAFVAPNTAGNPQGYVSLSTGSSAATELHTISGTRVSRFDAGMLYHVQIKLPTLADGQWFTIGAENEPGTRYHRALIRDGQLFAQYVDEAGVAQEVQLSSAGQPLTASWYYVDVETSDAGSTLYVYSGDRSNGFVHRVDTSDWGTARLSVSAQTAPARSQQRLEIYSLGEYRYSSQGSVLFEQSFGLEGGTAGLSGWPATNSLFMQTGAGLRVDTRLAGLSNAEQTVVGDAVYGPGDSGRIIFRSEVATGASAPGRNFRIGAESTTTGTAARALAARFIDGDLYAEYRSETDGAWTLVKLSTPTKPLKDGVAYVVEVTARPAGGALLNVYEKGTSAGAAGSFSYSITQDAWLDARSMMTAFGDQASTSAVMTVGRVQEIQIGAVTAYLKASFKYDALGRLRATIDGTSQRSHVLYDAAGRKVADIDPTGRLVEYVYDAAGRQVQSVEYATPVTPAALASLTDGNGDPVEVSLASVRPAADALNDRIVTRFFDAAGRLAGTQDAAGYLTEFLYDGNSRLIDTVAYATASTVVRIDTSAGSTTASPPAIAGARPAVDALNDRTARNIYSADGLLQATLDADGFLVEWEYDGAGRKVAETRYYNATDPADHADALSALRPAKNLLDRRSIYIYDNAGRAAADLNAEGYLTTYGHDLAGRLTSTTKYLATSHLTVWADGTGTVQYLGAAALDVASLLPADARKEVATQSYTVRGELEYETSAGNVVTKREYDANGRLTAVREDVDGDRRDTTYQYTFADLVSSVKDGEGKAVTYAYDVAGRRTRVQDAKGNKTFLYYDAAGRLRYEITRTELGGEVKENVYNVFGQVERTIAYAARLGTTDTNALTGGLVTAALSGKVAALANAAQDGSTTTYYTHRGEIQQAIDALGNKTDLAYTAFGQVQTRQTDVGDGRRTRMDDTYDRRGNQLTSVVDQSGLDIATATEYDAFGRVTATVDARGNRTTIQYLKNDGSVDSGRQVVVTDASLVARKTVYDAIDRVVLSTDGLNNSTTFVHDAADRTLTMTTAEGIQTVTEYDGHGEVIKVTDGTGAVTSYTYDGNGKLLTTTDAAGNVTQNTYDANGNLVKVVTGLESNGASAPTDDGSAVTTQYQFDAANRVLTQQVDPAGLDISTSYEYDGLGRAVKMTDAKGVVTTYAFDAKGQLEDVVVDDVAGGLRLRTSLTYDAQGRTLTIVKGAGTAAAETTEYRYDVAGRRTQEIVDPAGLDLITTYEYDKAGNVVLMRDPLAHGTRYVYDESGRLEYTIDAAGGVAQRLYDNEGRLTGTRSFATRIAGNSAARIWMRPGTDSSVSSALGHFAAGDVVTATVRFKSEAGVSGSMLLGDAGGPDPYDNSAYTLSYGTRTADGWQTMTLTHTMSHDDDMWIYLYADHDAVDAASGSSVLYDDVQITSVEKGVVFTDDFESGSVIGNGPAWWVSGPMGQTTQADIDLSTTTLSDAQIEAAVASLADARDEVEQIVYDKDGRARYAIDAEGGVTESRYDDMGRVTESIRYATAFVGTWASTSLPTIDAAHDQHSYFVYDAAGRARYGIDASGHVSETIYDRGSRAVAIKHYAKTITRPAVMSEANMAAAVAARLDTANDHVEFLVHDAAGRLRFSIDAEGFATEQELDALGRTTGTLRYSNVFGFSAPPSLAQMTAAVKQLATSGTDTYDAAGRRVRSVDGEGVVTTYAYDETGRVTQTTLAYGLSEASTSRRTYDGAGRVVEETVGFGTPEASTTRYRYDANGRLIAQTDPRGVAAASISGLSAADQAVALDNYTTRYGYDALGHRTTVIDPLGGVATTEYDTFGNAVKVTDPRGNAGYYYFDRRNLNTLVVDPEGFAVANTYDSFGNKVGATQYFHRAQGAWSVSAQPVIATAAGAGPYVLAEAARDSTVTFAYDKLGRLTRRTDAENLDGTSTKAFEEYGYDAFGNRTSLRNKAGGISSYTFDRRGLVLTETLPITTRTAAGATLAVVNRNVYDALGNRVQFIEAQGAPEQRVTTYRYDALGRLIETRGEAVTTYKPGVGYVNGVVPTTTRQYDARGNLIAETDANGGRTAHYYDALDRKIGEVSAAGTLSAWQYDEAGNAVNERIYGDPVSLPAGATLPAPVDPANLRETQFTYDANNHQTGSLMTGLLLGHYDDASSHFLIGAAYGLDRVATTKTYDAAGNVVKAVDGNGSAVYSFYDRDGQKILEVDAEGYATAWEHGVNGNTTRETKLAQRSGIEVTEASDPGALLAAWPADAGDRITDYTYDRDFRLVTESRLNVAYGQVNTGTGALTEAVGSATTTYAYDGLDKKIREIDANGQRSDWTYDAAGRLSQQQLPGFTDYQGASVRATTDFEYDGLNNVLRTIQRGKNGASETDDEITRFVYGTGGRLVTQFDANNQGTSFDHDAIGNITYERHDRTNADGVTSTEGTLFTFDAMSREVMRQSVTATPTWVLGDKHETRYDAYGEITGRRTNGGNAAGEWQEFAEYNALGKVVKTNSGTGITKAYIYDAAGNATLSIESAGANLRPLTITQILGLQTQIFQTITVFDKRGQVSQILQPTMDGTHDIADVQQFMAQQVTYSQGGGGQITNTTGLLYTASGGSAPPPAMTNAQRFQSLSTAVDWGVNGHSDGEGGYVYTSTHIDSVAVNLSVPAIGAYLGAWSSVRVRVDYKITGATNASGFRELVVTNRNATSATVNLGLLTAVGNVNFSYNVTVSYQYDGAPAATVAAAQFGSKLAFETTTQVSDGEGGYTAVVAQNFAAANAFNGSFKTNDLSQFASVVPSAGFSVWQDKVSTDTLSSTVNWSPHGSVEEFVYDSVVVQNITVNLPTASFEQTLKNFTGVTVTISYDLDNDTKGSKTQTVSIASASTTSVTIPVNLLALTSDVNDVKFTYTVTVTYQWVNSNQNITLASDTVSKAISYVTHTDVPDGEGGYIDSLVQHYAASNVLNHSFTAGTSGKTFFSGGSELSSADAAYLYYRTSSTAAYSLIMLTRGTTNLAAGSGSVAKGIFYIPNASIPSGIVDYKIIATDDGVLTGSFKSGSTSIAGTTGLNSASRTGLGEIFFETGPKIHFFDQNTPRLAIQYRPTGSTGAWAYKEVVAYNADGWFTWSWQAAGLSGNYDMRVLRLDDDGVVTGRMFTKVNLDATPTATAPVTYSEPYISLGGQPSNASTLTFKYRAAGSTGAFITTTFTKTSTGVFGRDFSAANLLPVVTASGHYDYEYQYEARDAGGLVVNGATGTFRVAANGKSFLSHTSTRLPTVVPFSIDDANALGMDIKYRPLGSTGAYTTVPRLSRTSNAVQFNWDASAITPASGEATFEYQYRLLDSAGQAVKNPNGEDIVVDGQVTVGNTTSQAAVAGWVITGTESSSNTIRRTQTHDAFGEVVSETDGRGYVTDSSYNTLGSLVLREDPTTDITGEDGVTVRARPQTRFYYDRTGKAVGTRDANGYLTTQLWTEGVGDPQVAKVFYPDAGNVTLSSYDVFGNQRMTQDGEGRQTTYAYDLKNQLTRLDRPTRGTGQYLQGQGSYETYEYDSAGQRIATTSVLGRTRTYYDIEGRVSKVTSIEGRSTTYAYAYDSTITGAGGVQVGGWKTVTTMSGGMVARENKDVFNRMTWRQDYGAHLISYGYNFAGWLSTQTSTLEGAPQQDLSYDYYANGYLKRQTDNVTQLQSDYAYDDNGNRVFEGSKVNTTGSTVYSNSTVTYDELNRVKTVTDPKYDISYKYDAVGNRRNVHSYYSDGLDGNKQTQDFWYLYDSLNRFTVTMGQLSGGVITRGATGKLISYDRANERMSAEYADADYAHNKKVYRERYAYTSDGYLQDMYLSTSTNGSAYVEQTQAASTRSTDLAGRVTNYVERNADNSMRTNVSRVFDADNRQLSEVDAAQLYNGAAKTDTYGYNADGTLKQIVTTNVQTGSTRSFAYEWWDTARQTELKVKVNGVENWADGTSKLTYDVNGNLYRATDVAGKRTIQYVSDGDGQILYRQELVARTDVSSDWNASTNEVVAGSVERRRNYYYLNGQRIGDVNNDNGMPSLTDYAVALAQAKSVSNDERNKKFTPTAYANFDENYQPINDAYPGTSPTTYTVGTGDTLSSIAARVWGDRAMWYLIADANGLSGVETLSAGMRLVIPNKVTNIHNNAGTLRVYDAGEAIGDVSPTLPPPPPPPHKDCGGLGTIVMIAIAVAVAFVVTGPAVGLLNASFSTTAGATAAGASAAGATAAGTSLAAAVGGAAVGGAAGSIASQGFAMAVGLQDEFSWKAVGQMALGSALTAGIGGLANQPGSVLSALKGPTTWASAGRAALSSGVSQALAGDWNWRNVMASAVGAGVGARAGASLQGSAIGRTLGSEGSRIAGGMVGSITGVWAAQGDRAQYSAVLASSLGNALGESLASMSGGVNWSQAPDESTAELARLERSGNRYAEESDQILNPTANPAGFARMASDKSPFLVTGDLVQAAEGTPGLRATDAVSQAYNDALIKIQTMKIAPIFDASDPHQYLLVFLDDGTRNSETQEIPTNVKQLSDLIASSDNPNVVAIYRRGVGAEHDLGGINSMLGLGVPSQISETLSGITTSVNRIYQNDSNATFVFADVGFSRGAGVVRNVQNLLFAQGVPDVSSAIQIYDENGSPSITYNNYIIPPGAANIGASLLYDTVTTGVGKLYDDRISNLVTQTLHLVAQNEYRDAFPSTSILSGPGQSTDARLELTLPGAHTNIGGGSYDQNGIGSENLLIGYTYLRRVGVPLGPMPMSLMPDPSQFIIDDSRFIRTGSFEQLVNNSSNKRGIIYMP
jgi:YD repeat-containing protein